MKKKVIICLVYLLLSLLFNCEQEQDMTVEMGRLVLRLFEHLPPVERAY